MTSIEHAAPLGLGVILGISAGIFTGIIAGPVGALIGFCAGAVAGTAAGMAMDRDEGRRAARSRELDEIIGVTGGNMGAAPVTIPPPEPSEARALAARERWLAEWLTPPPPVIG